MSLEPENTALKSRENTQIKGAVTLGGDSRVTCRTQIERILRP